MAIKIGSDSRFQWGINIDDMWRYAGLPPPKSVAIPYLLSMASQSGKFDLPLQKTPNAYDSNIGTPHLAEVLATFLRRQGVNFVRCWFPWNFFERTSAQKEQSSASLDESTPLGYRFPLDNFVSKMNESGIGIIWGTGQRLQPIPSRRY